MGGIEGERKFKGSRILSRRRGCLRLTARASQGGVLRGAGEARLCHEYAAISHTPNCAVEREVGDTNFPALRALLVSQGCRGSNANNSS
ncbi:hypothetical protein QLX08_001343 [Tetragonisca angustula]|uniref:Uncharacterized protein n=1 Tax=Tetragonisca angustula TaxID=166442 RepID=A0AAW1AI12_9HYME